MSDPLRTEGLEAGMRWAFNGAAEFTSAPALSHLPDCAPREQKGERETPNLLEMVRESGDPNRDSRIHFPVWKLRC